MTGSFGDSLKGRTLHLTPEPNWFDHQGKDAYLPESFDAVGFVHCTYGEAHLLAAGNRYYRDDPRPFLLLEIDLNQVRAPVLYDDEHRRFPHVHGPIDCFAIVSVRRVQRDAHGSFVAIGELLD